jgi:cardiolipin-specific phospholipase
VDSLEDWRGKMGLDKMTLIGHSLGAYFSVVYALKYPTRVQKLILLSPAGVPRDPNAALSKELTDSQNTLNSATPTDQQTQKRQESRGRRLLMYLWEEGWSPFQVVRSTFFWGPMLIGKVCLLGAEIRVQVLTSPLIVFVSSVQWSDRGGHTRSTRLHPQYHAREGLW